MRTLILTILMAGCALSQAQRKPGLYVVFETSEGRITARLFEKEVPETVRNFVALAKGEKAWRDPALRKLVKRPLYNGITFHRVVAGEMVQAGDPTGLGTHNCGITIRDEVLPGLRFDGAGKLAMANTGTPDSGGCQFFITEGPMPTWTGKYTIFGQVAEGQDVVHKIARGKVKGDRPVEPVKLLRVTFERQ
jgi:peptidyl-prolyl cis-trans isomerase A (cyclophilin A)